jgi:DNA gyrase subunit A
MEQDKIIEEFSVKLEEIAEYQSILGDTDRLMMVIREELEIVRAEFGDPRRTQIIESQHDFTVEDLIAEEERVVTISHGGYAKTQPLSDYQAQRRGGMGKSATAVKDEDFVEHLLIASTHTTILCFTNAGKVYWLKVYQIPVAGRNSRGRPVINLLPLEDGERINSILPVEQYRDDHFVIMATANGTVKKTALSQYSNPRKVGLRAVDLVDGDHLVGTAVVDNGNDVMLFSSEGKAVRFAGSDVRAMGRVSKGVRGMRLSTEHRVISMVIPAVNGYLLTVCDNGYGKRTSAVEFPTKGRGGKGMIAIQASDRNGPLVGATQLFDGDEIMLISDQGTMVRTRGDEVSVVGRNTQGVRIIRLKENENLVSLARIAEPDEIEEGESDDLSDE